jgi:alcohol dehydrogenase (cytochrome c)
MSRCIRTVALGWLVVAAGMRCAALGAEPASPGLEAPDDWPQYHRTWNAWRYSPLDQVHRGNVQRLRVAWIHQPGDITHGIQSTPVVLEGVVYYTSAFNVVHAVDGATGVTLWRYKPKLDAAVTQAVFPAWNRGVAVAHGRVYLGTVDGRAIALDQKTGQELWATQLTPFKGCHGCNFTSPPVVAGDMLTFGPTGGDLASRGQIYGVKAATGRLAWTFDTIRDDPASWPGDTGRFGGGGAWMPGTYDPTTDTVIYGTGNAAPWAPEERRGDNLYTASIVNLDPGTGRLKWHRQEIPHDAWDYDAAYEAVMISRDGRDYLVHLNKGGFVFVMDKHDGALRNVWRFARHITWVDDIHPTTGELVGRREHVPGSGFVQCPATSGARQWNAGAYSPRTGLWYLNGMESCITWTTNRVPDPSRLPLAQPYSGVRDVRRVPPPGEAPSARLDARDPITGELRWSIPYTVPAYAGVLATGGDLIFNQDGEGVVRAHDAETGAVLWSFRTGSGSRGGIVSYTAGGRQVILVPSGFGGYAAISGPQWFPELGRVSGGAAMIAFTLDTAQ